MNHKIRRTALLCGAVLLSNSLTARAFTFKDVTGQEITLDAQPARIVTLPQPAPATLIALDGNAARIVGMNEGSKRAFENGMMSVMFPDSTRINSNILSESGGWMPNVEVIAALKPDLVIQWGARGDGLINPLRHAGLPVALMVGGGNNGTETLARENMRMAAEITGQSKKLSELFRWRDRVMAQITAGLEKAPAAARPSILHLRSSKSRLTATGGNSYQNIFIELVGANNAAKGVGVQSTVSAEQILTWNPDIIIVSAAEPDAGIQAIYQDPLLSRLNAARENRIYKTPAGGYIWDSASHESPFTWMWLANLTHPEIFHFDLRQELRSGFRLLYGYELTGKEIDRILRMDINGGTNGYQVFARHAR